MSERQTVERSQSVVAEVDERIGRRRVVNGPALHHNRAVNEAREE